MKRFALVTTTLLVVLLTGACVENTAPGNDREAALEPPAPPAELASAGAALQNVATGLIMPEIITDADRTNLPGGVERCTFRMTTVGMPVLFYDGTAVIKLNGKLVPLDGQGEGRFGSGGVEVMVRPLDEAETGGGQFEAEFVLRLEGAPNELGFHGFAEC